MYFIWDMYTTYIKITWQMGFVLDRVVLTCLAKTMKIQYIRQALPYETLKPMMDLVNF